MTMITFDSLDISKNADGLIPAIIQDDRTLTVLMLGYMNREAFDKTVSEKRVTFFSRTKNRLWTKGETSGNFMEVASISADCDRDTLLVRVIPQGPTCHNGTKSCFTTYSVNKCDAITVQWEDLTSNETEGFIRYLQSVIQRRHKEMPEGSYTTKLFEKGIAKISQKVGEEAVETVIDAVAGNKEGFLYEASDLIYHLLVLLEASSCSIADIEQELAKRHK